MRRFVAVAVTVLTAAALAGCASDGPPTAALANDGELQRAYDAAWQVSNQLEEWGNFVVDGESAERPTAADWERVFHRITEVIEALCATGEVECKYPGQGY